MKIRDVVYSTGLSGYFNKDLLAVKAGARPNGTFLEGKPLTPGYTHIVQAGAIISIMLVLEDGSVAVGECADVIFSGLAGRDPLFVPGGASAAAGKRGAALAGRPRCEPFSRPCAGSRRAWRSRASACTRRCATASRRRCWRRPRWPAARPWPK